ncbi:phosphotransferase family protein [Paenibacillus uliginis]|nr:aminoglycoside phosphotransferase family protein [Paenibacillus uliginis]
MRFNWGVDYEMSYLFTKEINDWNSWGAVYQSIEDFRPLIQEIFVRERLMGAEDISHLTPGTNAVFKAGSYVIKIFAPTSSGMNTDQDYKAERSAMQRAIDQGVRTPNIVAASKINDKYEFKYIIMDFIEGQSAGDAINGFTVEQKRDFVGKLQEDMVKLNTLPDQEVSRDVIIERAIHNDRWKVVSPELRKQIEHFLNHHELGTCIHVHGDLTGDNVIIDSKDQVYIIDFADSSVAPIEYEYPGIVFELFQSDVETVHEFIKCRNLKYSEFIDLLFAGTMLHDFGANFVKSIYEKHTGKGIGEMSNISEFKELIHTHLMPDFKCT